jgi:cell division protein FtsZ
LAVIFTRGLGAGADPRSWSNRCRRKSGKNQGNYYLTLTWCFITGGMGGGTGTGAFTIIAEIAKKLVL